MGKKDERNERTGNGLFDKLKDVNVEEVIKETACVLNVNSQRYNISFIGSKRMEEGLPTVPLVQQL